MEERVLNYGIKYRVLKLEDNKFLMIPVSLVKGDELGYVFVTDEETLLVAKDKQAFEKEYVVDSIVDKEELEYIYEFNEDEDFLADYYFADKKDIIFLVDTSGKEETITRKRINLRDVQDQKSKTSLIQTDTEPAIILNEKALEELLKTSSPEEQKLLLNRYKQLVKSFKTSAPKRGITKINMTNGKVESIETENRVINDLKVDVPEKESKPSKEISYKGLRDHLKERIFGHDEEIETIAQKLYMNVTAKESESTESILLVGPTGNGKTETVHAACEYLGLPFVEANASNIVPQGIKGTSIEDILSELYEASGKDIKRAQRGLVFLDEFDKLNDSDLDIKRAVKNILLTFTSGGVFPVDSDHYHFSFNSSMTNKIYAGVFERILLSKKTVGFGSKAETSANLGDEEEIKRKIIEKGYFSLEELSRISSVLGYEELDRETKRQILLENKHSEFRRKKDRYKRQFGIDLIADESYIDAILDSLEKHATGMRSVNNNVKRIMNVAERKILEEEDSHFKKLVLTRDTVEDPSKFELY